jgi:hypothetical protein
MPVEPHGQGERSARCNGRIGDVGQLGWHIKLVKSFVRTEALSPASTSTSTCNIEECPQLSQVLPAPLLAAFGGLQLGSQVLD